MTETQYWILLGISIAGIVGYAMCYASRKTDEAWAKHKDEHEQIETRKEFRK